MKPIGPLMREHRLIERMVAVMSEELERMGSEHAADIELVRAGVDFFRTYADRTHHGKEEDILFRDLEKKNLEEGLRRIMEELVEEHRLARGMVRRLDEAAGRYRGGDGSAVQDMASVLGELVRFYPAHIEKEDKRFFFPVQEYFDKREQAAMLQEFVEFDAGLIHEKYRSVVQQRGQTP